MVDITEISAVVAAAGVLVGVLYYIVDMRHQARVRDIELILQLYAFFDDRQFQDDFEKVFNSEFKDYDDFVEKYGPLFGRKNREMQAALTTVLNHFDLLGTLLKRKLASVSLLRDSGAGEALPLWEKIGPLMKGYRKDKNHPNAWKDFEYLYNELKKRQQQASKTA